MAQPLLSDGGNVRRNHDERVWGFGIFDSSSWPIILDLLDDAGVSWKIYYIGFDSVENGDTDNVAVFWRRWAQDPDDGDEPRLLRDCRTARSRGVVDHLELLDAVRRAPRQTSAVGMGSSSRSSTRCAVTAWEPVRLPPHLRRARRLLRSRRAAAGRRVRPRDSRPVWVVSPFADAGRSSAPAGRARVDAEVHRAHWAGCRPWRRATTPSTTSTPTGGNFQTGGAPAPPRDGLALAQRPVRPLRVRRRGRGRALRLTTTYSSRRVHRRGGGVRPLHGPVLAPLAPRLADLAGVAGGQRVLDVGCGPGALTASSSPRRRRRGRRGRSVGAVRRRGARAHAGGRRRGRRARRGAAVRRTAPSTPRWRSSSCTS